MTGASSVHKQIGGFFDLSQRKEFGGDSIILLARHADWSFPWIKR